MGEVEMEMSGRYYSYSRRLLLTARLFKLLMLQWNRPKRKPVVCI
jgi:hypothetical protein